MNEGRERGEGRKTYKGKTPQPSNFYEPRIVFDTGDFKKIITATAAAALLNNSCARAL